MRKFLFILLCLFVFVGCRKNVHRHDRKFRNQFVGTYQIDSVVYHLPNMDSSSGEIKDTNFVVLPLPNDFFEILPTKDQIEKNVTNMGKFLDSIFTYEIQGFEDDKTGHLSITYCNDCPYSSVMQHFIGVHYIVIHDDKKLVMESRFNLNEKPYFSRVHLSKK